MRHTGERNHGCAICNKQFVLKHELDAHMNVHTRLKKFECGICYQKFTRKHQIQIHQKRYHPGEEIDLHVSVFTK